MKPSTKRLDRWCDIEWIVFLCVTGAVTAICCAVFWDEMPLGARGSAFLAMIMPFHVLEEWKFPGGLHYFYNLVFTRGGKTGVDITRYPMSRLTDMATNVGLQWIPLVYLVISLFTDLSTPIAMCMMVFSFLEVAAHTGGGIVTWRWYRDKGKRTIYHPGLATSLMMFLPTGVYLAARMPTLTGSDWMCFVILFLIMVLICVPLSEAPLKAWVIKQEPGAFSFEDAKYYMRFGGYKKDEAADGQAQDANRA